MAETSGDAIHVSNGIRPGVSSEEPKPASIHYDEFVEHPEHPERVLIANPLRNLPKEEVERRARAFRRTHGLRGVVDKKLFVRAALAASNPDGLADIKGLTKLERISLEKDRTMGFWGQMKSLTREFIQILTTCCIAAIVQGWDQSSINGANLGWPKEFGLKTTLTNANASNRDVWIFGIVNAASYFSAALIGSQLSDPLNEYAFGRRGALFIAALFSFSTVIAAAYVHSWELLLACRILLGIGIGAKASVVAVYIAETAPSKLRGSLIISWQIFVACGIFLGAAANLVVFNDWRKQVASPFIPAIPLIILVPFCYESPRWLYKHNRVKDALDSFRHLRRSDILACRDLILMHNQLEGEIKYFMRKADAERPMDRTPEPEDANEDSDEEHDDEEVPAPVTTPTWGDRFRELRSIYMPKHHKPVSQYQLEIRKVGYFQRLRQLFVRPHIRATTAAACVMAGQQLCGVNILAFLSSTVFSDAIGNTSELNRDTNDQDATSLAASKKALWMSFGFGMSNFVFTWLAWGTIDKKGRRWLLNWSFPNMAWNLLALGLCFQIDESRRTLRVGLIVLFTILFALAYSPGVGPVPFTASAEMFPLFIREVGMSFAVFVNLLGAGVIALVVQPLSKSIGHTGMLCFFMGLDLVGWALCYLFYPETARISLEELRAVFDVPLGDQARYRIMYLHYLFNYYVLRRKNEEQPEPIHIWYKEWSQYRPSREEIVAKKRRLKEERRRMRDEKRHATQTHDEVEVSIDDEAEDGERSIMQLELERERTRNAELMRRIEELERSAGRGSSRSQGDDGRHVGASASSTGFLPGIEGS
ncbi:MFS general substrate transporter [Rhizodiscina lignyota]|uniref:MFS general substrate transporter n=1 Tax=Rhizodiscina lignyota TaxID=1504668 RepID=A0A9P4IMD9_9PEZI|nr:MFS general substrate transporter [Rhizodiscina lignyota]